MIFKKNTKYFETLLLIFVYGIASLISIRFSFISGIFLIISGLLLYFYFAHQDNQSYIKLKAVFSISWLTTIGLANFRLLEYQVSWSPLTWLLLASAHIVFINANDFSKRIFVVLEEKLNFNRINKSNKLPVEYRVSDDRLFWIATVTSVIGIASFLINVYIKGYIPFFATSTNPNAYVDFYTRFHTFVVASMVSGGLSYYTLKKVNLSKVKKIFLIIYIIVIVFILPILLVQRGTFINAALILAAMVYLLSNKKFVVLLISVLIIFSVYILGSKVRGYTDEQLNDFFQPKEISIIEDPDEEDKEPTTENPEENSLSGEEQEPLLQRGFKLSPDMAFLYSYLTVSHDNFNSAVINNDTYTYGLWQFQPFNVILRIDWINEKLQEAENTTAEHRVLPHLNTFNLIAKAFYDFGIIGVIIFTFIWSLSFGIVEQFVIKYDGPFSKLAYGVIMTPIVLSFMNPWLSLFPIWMMWGTVLIMFIFYSIKIKKRGTK